MAIKLTPQENDQVDAWIKAMEDNVVFKLNFPKMVAAAASQIQGCGALLDNNWGSSSFGIWFRTLMNCHGRKRVHLFGQVLKFNQRDFPSPIDLIEKLQLKEFFGFSAASSSDPSSPTSIDPWVAFKPPINSWPNFFEFRAFLDLLRQLNIADQIERGVVMTRDVALMNMYYPPGGYIKSDFTGWFFHFYTLRGPSFSQDVYKVLESNLPSTRSLLDAIDRSAFRAMFVTSSAPPAVYGNQREYICPPGDDSMEGVVPTINSSFGKASHNNSQLFGMDYLVNLLNPHYYNSRTTLESKKTTIRENLASKPLNDNLRRRVPWLLPDQSTLADLMANCSGNWAPLVAVLCEIGERAIGESYNTFPSSGDIRSSLELALQSTSQIPLLEVVLYDPKMTPEDRVEIWRHKCGSVLNQATICKFLGTPAKANRQLSAEGREELFNDLLKAFDDPNIAPKIKAHIFDQRDKVKDLPMARFDSLVQDLFEAPVGQMAELDFSDKPTAKNQFNAKQYLEKLSINNPELLGNLKEVESDTDMFLTYHKLTWPAEFNNWGAKGVQGAKLTNALFKDGWILDEKGQKYAAV